jgi:hypothetical protein
MKCPFPQANLYPAAHRSIVWQFRQNSILRSTSWIDTRKNTATDMLKHTNMQYLAEIDVRALLELDEA